MNEPDTESQLTGSQLLYVEDSPVIAKATVARLLKAGYSVEHFATGESALEALQAGRHFELALIDVNLGRGLDGAQTARLMLELVELPIVFLSAHADLAFVGRVESIKNYGYVLKSPGEYILLQTLKGTMQLISEQKRTRELLESIKTSSETHTRIDKANLTRLDLIMDIARIAWWETNLDTGRVNYSSKKTDMLGYQAADFTHYMDFVRLLHKDDYGRAMRKMKELVDGKSSTYDVEYRILAADGTYRWFRDLGGFVVDPNTSGDRIVSGIVINITAQKQTEAALIEAERLRVVGEVAAAVAHDFNNSLQAISGHVQLANLEPGLTPELRNRLQIIGSLVVDASKRVRPLQHRKPDGAESKVLDLNLLVREAVEHTRPFWKDHAQAAGVTVSVHLRLESVRPVRAEASDIRHVIFNLVKNAVEAMPNGGNLGLSTLDTDDRVVLLVSDSGTGMDEATQLKLFQPFYTTKGPTRGRGLGMSSSLSLTTKHKGTLRVVESRLGEGTTLELALPAAAEPSSLIPQESSAAPEALRRLRVLWVDDEPDIRLSGCEILDLLGHLAVGAASAQEALDLALGQSFDLIISDLGMPEMNGWQLVRELERHHCLVPVVILTGWAGDPLTSTPTSSLPEVLDVLAKPLDLGQLKALLRRVAHLPPLPGND